MLAAQMIVFVVALVFFARALTRFARAYQERAVPSGDPVAWVTDAAMGALHLVVFLALAAVLLST